MTYRDYIAKLGWKVFPLRPNSKAPATQNGYKDATNDLLEADRLFSANPRFNTGIPTGQDQGFIVLDIDPRNGGDKQLEALISKYGPLPLTPKVKTWSGGWHYYFAYPQEGIPSFKVDKGIDIKSDGGYVVAPPSGILGSAYEWINDPVQTELAEAPAWLLNLQKYRNTRPVKIATKISKGERDNELARLAAVFISKGVSPELTKAELRKTLREYTEDGFEFCEKDIDRWVKGAVAKFSPFAHQKGPETGQIGEISQKVGVDMPSKEKFEYGRNGSIKNTLKNSTLAFRTFPELKGLFSYNLFSNEITFNKEPDFPTLHHKGDSISDDDVSALRQYIIDKYNIEFSKENVQESIRTEALKIQYHPVREWLRGLKWDGVKRVHTLFPKYFQAEDNEYTREIGRILMLALCKRVDQPGCKYDYMVILDGEQGVGKSRALQILGGQWYASIDLMANYRDLVTDLAGGWVIEVEEMAAFSKRDIETLKSIITKSVDKVTLKYNKWASVIPRQCVLVGTINTITDDYLRDPTGNRRFLPIEVGRVDCSQLQQDRDQLFAEAWHIYNNNKQVILYITDETIELSAEEVRSQKTGKDPFFDTIEEWVDKKIKLGEDCIQIKTVWEEALDGDIKQLNKSIQNRIGVILRQLGFRNRVIRFGETTKRLWKYEPSI